MHRNFTLLGILMMHSLGLVPDSRAEGFRPCLDPVLHALASKNPYWARDLKFTNTRNWDTYRETLVMKRSDLRGAKTLIDLGAGKGIAVREAVERLKLERAVAIDLHDHFVPTEWEGFHDRVEEKILHHTEAAESALLRHPGEADLIVDNYGAYTYSPARIHLLEAAFQSLKPGGKAFLRIPPASFVKTPSGLQPLEEYLVERFPGIFGIRTRGWFPKRQSELEGFTDSRKVLVMTRPKKSTNPLRLNLQVSEQTEWSHPGAGKIRIPVLHLSVQPPLGH
jgi:SAM-dependent methyltransferase